VATISAPTRASKRRLIGPAGDPIVHVQAQLGAALDPPEAGGGGAGDQPQQLLEALDVAGGWFDLQHLGRHLEGPPVGDDRPGARLVGRTGHAEVPYARLPVACPTGIGVQPEHGLGRRSDHHADVPVSHVTSLGAGSLLMDAGISGWQAARVPTAW
jgi:hypothetical protein